MVKFPRIAATRPQITRKFVSSKHPDASASPYSHAYSPCAHAAQAASLSDPHIASKSTTRFGMRHPRYRANLSPPFLLLLVSLAPAPAQHAFRIPVGQASQAAEKVVYFVIPSEARNLSSI